MYCKSCGKQIDIDSVFCSFCGTKQSTELKPKVQDNGNNELSTEQNRTIINNDANRNLVNHIKYDPTYKKENEALTFGIVLLVISLIIAVIGPIEFEDSESYSQFRTFASLASLILRIIITVWVVNIAKRQNRETTGWGLLAFFLPSIALIIISTMKKLFANIEIVEGLDSEQNSKILSDKAKEFYNDTKYTESIRFAEKAIELNSSNEIANDILKKSKEAFAEINDSIQTVIRETVDGKQLKIVSKFNQTIGASVFIAGLPAPNGIYNYKDWTHKLIVEDGKIKERYFILKVKGLVIEKSEEHSPKKGDKVFLDNGEKAPNGKYSLGFMAPKMIVEDGMFLRYE
jgi:hypothetical protein